MSLSSVASRQLRNSSVNRRPAQLANDRRPSTNDGLELLRPSGERQQCDIPRLLDRPRQPTLMRCAYARQATRRNLPALGDKLHQQPHILVIDGFNLLHAKLANFLAPENICVRLRANHPVRRPAVDPEARRDLRRQTALPVYFRRRCCGHHCCCSRLPARLLLSFRLP